MLDLIVRNAKLPGQKDLTDIACQDGKIVETGPELDVVPRKRSMPEACWSRRLSSTVTFIWTRR